MEIHVAGDYANLRLLLEELGADDNFTGTLHLGEPQQADGTSLDHASWSDLLIWIEQATVMGSSGALARIAVEAAIKRARGRGKIIREEHEE